ncbi:MAG TPA: amidohydrolase family protein, partial [Actinomycetota bacterium]|nr:amidohydrolase family protein [Actinomycetota bacterium]
MISIHGVRLIDGTGAEPVDRTDLSIDDDRIVGIGPAPRAENPLDLDGLTVMPGLIDAHAHVGLVDLSEEGVYEAPAVMAAKIFAVCSQALDQGFTTVRDAGGVDGGVARAQREGLIRGPRIFPSGPIHCQTGGHGDLRQP